MLCKLPLILLHIDTENVEWLLLVKYDARLKKDGIQNVGEKLKQSS